MPPGCLSAGVFIKMSNHKSQNSSEWDVPEYSRSQVKRAGKKLIDPECTEEERLKSNKVLSNWRASHAYTTNQLFNILKEKSLGVNDNSIVVQRLKRMPSITGKLKRFRQMGLDRMQDLGGVRTVLKSTEEVYDVRNAMLRDKIEHTLHKEDDYIQNPKDTGYRGIHLVYKYSPAEDENKAYCNLLTELQIRSEIQHSWATAVEIIDIITKQSLKTTQEKSDWSEFFALVGDEFAVLEEQPIKDTKLSPEQRKGRIRGLERKLGVLNKLEKLSVLPLIMDNVSVSGELFLLELDMDRKTIKGTRYNPQQVRDAHERYDELERQYKETSSVDVLLVSADSLDALRTAYPNYFADANKFIDYLNQRLGSNYGKLVKSKFAPSLYGYQGVDQSLDYIQNKTRSADSYFHRGLAKFNLGQYAEAIEDYSKAIELDPDLAEAYNNLGLANFALGQNAESIEEFNKAIDLKPDVATGFNNRGFVKSSLGQYAEAIKDYNKAIELDPDLAEAYNNRGVDKLNLGQYAEAIKDYNKAIELDPDFAKAYYDRGLFNYNLGQHAEAIKDYSKAIELEPDFSWAYSNRGVAKLNLGQYAEAIKDYNKAIGLNPDLYETYYNRGLAKLNLGQYTEAIEDYRKAIELNPDDADAHYRCGLANSMVKGYAEAIEDYSKAINLEPDYVDAYYNRGIANLNLNKSMKAIKDYDKVIELKSDYADAYSNRGVAKFNLGGYEGAIEDYNKAIELKSDYADAYSNRGNAKFNLGGYAEAIEDCSKAIELNPNHAKAHFNRGIANLEIRENEKAIEDFKKALHLAQEQGDTQLTQAVQKILTELKP